MKKVLILLSTYNGEKYLKEQLDSLYAQENVDVHILARDDGSSDSTLKILQDYKTRYGGLDIIEGNNIGAGKSFFHLAHYAVLDFQNYDYYSFCDQDDVWLPNKLHSSVCALDKITQPNKLYFGRATFVDQNLHKLGDTNKIICFDYTTSVYRNPALGCTMVFDYTLLRYFNITYPHLEKIESLHDAWMFKCAIYLNATIISDDNINILYRQHNNNVTSAYKSTFKKYKSLLMRKFKKKGFYRKNIQHFLDIYRDSIPDYNKIVFLESLATYNLSIYNTIKYLNNQSWKTENNFDKILWRILVLLKLF